MRRTRSGFTLMELILALGLTALLLSALYVSVDVQLSMTQANREAVERTTLSRALYRRMSDDISSAVTLCDPGRFRREDTAEVDEVDTGEDPLEDPDSLPIALTFPLGVVGDSTTIHLFTSRLPKEVFQGPNEDGTYPRVSDLRRISYWLAGGLDGPLGLARQEVTSTTTPEAINLILPTEEGEGDYIEAREVRFIEFSYFDGIEWLDSWDSTLPGDDGVTPIGPPRAVAIVMGLTKPGFDSTGLVDENELDFHRHVVAITTANGDTQAEDLAEEGEEAPAP